MSLHLEVCKAGIQSQCLPSGKRRLCSFSALSHNTVVIVIIDSPLDLKGIFLFFCLVLKCTDSWGSYRLLCFYSG